MAGPLRGVAPERAAATRQPAVAGRADLRDPAAPAGALGRCACCRSRSTPARTTPRRSRRWSSWPGRSRWSARRCTTSSRCTATSCASADGAHAFVEACRAAMCERGPLRRQRRIDALIAVHSCTWDRAAERVHKLLVEFAHEPAGARRPRPARRRAARAASRTAARRARPERRAGMPDALRCVGRDRRRRSTLQEESAMNRSISLSLTLAVALASQVALGGCSKKEDVAHADRPTPPPPPARPTRAPPAAMGTASRADGQHQQRQRRRRLRWPPATPRSAASR